MQIYREIGDQEDVGNLYINLGRTWDDRGKYDEALKLSAEGLQGTETRNQNEDVEALYLNDIGNTYLFKGDYDSARIYFEQTLHQCREDYRSR